MGLKWKFQRGEGGGGGGLKPKNLPWEGYGYFLEQHNITSENVDVHQVKLSCCLLASVNGVIVKSIL